MRKKKTFASRAHRAGVEVPTRLTVVEAAHRRRLLSAGEHDTKRASVIALNFNSHVIAVAQASQAYAWRRQVMDRTAVHHQPGAPRR
jgi:hypothetical protein